MSVSRSTAKKLHWFQHTVLPAIRRIRETGDAAANARLDELLVQWKDRIPVEVDQSNQKAK